jgi:hypothetical protein
MRNDAAVFRDWIPVSQYHASIASDKLVPLHGDNATTTSPSVVHVKSPTPDFKRLNHSVIARCSSTHGIDEYLQSVLEGSDAMHRPGTRLQSCTASASGTKKGAQSPDKEPTLATLLEDNVCDSILEEGTHHAQQQSWRQALTKGGGLSRNPQVRSIHNHSFQKMRPAYDGLQFLFPA